MAVSRVGIGILVGCALGAALALSGTLTRLGFPTAAPAREPGAPSAAVTPARAVLSEGDPVPDLKGHSRFAILAQEAGPGVVNVHTSRTVTQQPFESPFPFGPFGQPGAPSQAPRSFTVPSLGTGFLISEDGYIVTNNHVVDGVDDIRVTFS